MKTSIAAPITSASETRLMAVMQAVDEHHCHLRDYLYSYTRHHQDAENLVQDLWVYVLRKFDEEKIGSLPLLRHKARQLFIDHYRRQKRRGEVLTDELPEIPIPPIPYSDVSPEGESDLQEKFWADYPFVNLTAQQKEVLWLSAYHRFTYKEIEARTGVASSTIGDWIVEARQKIAAAINAEAKQLHE